MNECRYTPLSRPIGSGYSPTLLDVVIQLGTLHLKHANVFIQVVTEDWTMLHSDDIDDLKAKHICFECVGDAYLSEEIEQNGKINQCSYCHTTAESYSIEKLAERIETAFDHHYYRTSDQPNSWQQSLLADRESNYDWERDGVPVVDAIEAAADIPQNAAEDVQAVLDDKHADFESAKMGEETEFSSDSCYEERGASDRAWQEEWREFERSLKKEARFFSRFAATHLSSVFGGIDRLMTTDGCALVVGVGPQLELDHLYRARVFQADDKLEEALCRPDLHLGSPPASLANAGRMNARGISVFYGTTEATVAIAEVRPPVGSKVAVARFNIIRPLRLLDLTALDKVQDGGSIFDLSLKGRLERVAFLQSLGRRITRPVMPNDEVFDYLATQAIADFLATENDPLLDGIIFRSAQVKNGRNVVLFQKAARVEMMELPEGTEINAQSGYETEDGWEVDYSVTELVPPPSPPPKQNDGWPYLLSAPENAYSWEDDFRESTLQIDPKSVVVHQVDWVEYMSISHKVDRHRREKHDSKF